MAASTKPNGSLIIPQGKPLRQGMGQQTLSTLQDSSEGVDHSWGYCFKSLLMMQ